MHKGSLDLYGTEADAMIERKDINIRTSDLRKIHLFFFLGSAIFVFLLSTLSLSSHHSSASSSSFLRIAAEKQMWKGAIIRYTVNNTPTVLVTFSTKNQVLTRCSVMSMAKGIYSIHLLKCNETNFERIISDSHDS